MLLIFSLSLSLTHSLIGLCLFFFADSVIWLWKRSLCCIYCPRYSSYFNFQAELINSNIKGKLQGHHLHRYPHYHCNDHHHFTPTFPLVRRNSSRQIFYSWIPFPSSVIFSSKPDMLVMEDWIKSYITPVMVMLA